MSEINIEDFITEVETEPRAYKKGFSRIKSAFSLNWKNAIKDPFESIRWIVALYLDENPYYCWADLVMWAQDMSGYGFFEGLRDRKELFMAGNCGYCGKCEVKED
jgi:hypothetical protein